MEFLAFLPPLEGSVCSAWAVHASLGGSVCSGWAWLLYPFVLGSVCPGWAWLLYCRRAADTWVMERLCRACKFAVWNQPCPSSNQPLGPTRAISNWASVMPWILRVSPGALYSKGLLFVARASGRSCSGAIGLHESTLFLLSRQHFTPFLRCSLGPGAVLPGGSGAQRQGRHCPRAGAPA